MAQALKKPVPSLTAARLAAFTTVAAAPGLHSPTTFHGEVLYPQWWRNPAIIMRGWHPRTIVPRLSFGERIGADATAALDQMREWRERARSRQALLKLDDHMLRDLGIDRATANYMGSLPFWRADD